MATELATAYISVVPSFQGIQGQVAKGMAPVAATAGKAGADSGKKFGGSFLGGIKGLAAGLGVTLGIGALTKGLGAAIAEGREAQKVGAITTNVIKQTGGAANVTAGQVGKLAEAIGLKAGMDDEAIQKGANLLLTFKNVRNEAGKGNAVFNRATQAAVDLSAAGFGSVDSSAKMLGKALNDPIKGLSALGRAGVTFTEQQKKQIESMVKSGDVLGAQKIIMKEVESQVGGAAAASATAGDKLRASWGNFMETVGTALIPILDKLFVFIANKVLPGILKLGPAFSAVGKFIAPVVEFFKNLISGAASGEGSMSTFAVTVLTVWNNIKAIFTSAVSIIKSLWGTFGGTILATARAVFPPILSIIRGAFTVIAGIFKTIAAVLRGDWSAAWNGIKQIVAGAWTAIKGIVSVGWNLIKGAFKLGGAALKAIFGGLWKALKSLVAKGASALVAAIKAIPGKLRALGGLFQDAGKWLIQAVIKGLTKIGSTAANFANNIWRAVKSVINSGIRRLNSLLEFTINPPIGPSIHINPPNIPQLAAGGIVTRPTLALIGEAGPEAVVPLSGRHAPNTTAGGDRPIYTDTGTLLGWIREVANGEARLVWRTADHQGALTARYAR